jgi:hypothetical protein
MGPKAQYCSLSDPDPLGEVGTASAPAVTWTQVVVAQFPFYATRIDPVPARYDAFFKDLVENRFMQGLLLLRGNSTTAGYASLDYAHRVEE